MSSVPNIVVFKAKLHDFMVDLFHPHPIVWKALFCFKIIGRDRVTVWLVKQTLTFVQILNVFWVRIQEWNETAESPKINNF